MTRVTYRWLGNVGTAGAYLAAVHGLLLPQQHL